MQKHLRPKGQIYVFKCVSAGGLFSITRKEQLGSDAQAILVAKRFLKRSGKDAVRLLEVRQLVGGMVVFNFQGE